MRMKVVHDCSCMRMWQVFQGQNQYTFILVSASLHFVRRLYNSPRSSLRCLITQHLLWEGGWLASPVHLSKGIYNIPLLPFSPCSCQTCPPPFLSPLFHSSPPCSLSSCPPPNPTCSGFLIQCSDPILSSTFSPLFFHPTPHPLPSPQEAASLIIKSEGIERAGRESTEILTTPS